jgi:hypothetical protein
MRAKGKADDRTQRMLATVVPLEVATEFERVAKAHERTVAAELRTLIREHIDAHEAEPTGAAA